MCKKERRERGMRHILTSPLVPPSFSIKQTIFWMKQIKKKKQSLACYLHAEYPHPVQTLMPDPKAICSSNQHMHIRLKWFSNKQTWARDLIIEVKRTFHRDGRWHLMCMCVLNQINQNIWGKRGTNERRFLENARQEVCGGDCSESHSPTCDF